MRSKPRASGANPRLSGAYFERPRHQAESLVLSAAPRAMQNVHSPIAQSIFGAVSLVTFEGAGMRWDMVQERLCNLLPVCQFHPDLVLNLHDAPVAVPLGAVFLEGFRSCVVSVGPSHFLGSIFKGDCENQNLLSLRSAPLGTCHWVRV